MSVPRLSKSRILNFLQCPKRLYLQVHRPELAEEAAGTQQVFTVGHQVGEIARRLEPHGILIGHDLELAQALKDTRATLKEHPDRPLFEATFEHDGVLIRADVLIPEGNRHRLVEVKSSAEVKDYHFADCAVQAWVLEGAGHPLARIELAHVDTAFVYPGGGDYRGLLHHEDITEPIQPLTEQVPRWVEESRLVLAGEEPRIRAGQQCDTPYPCPFFDYCSPPEPEEYPVTLLPNDRNNRVSSELQAEGIRDIRAIPPGRLTNPRHEWIRRVTVDGKPDLKPEAAEELRNVPYPRNYLDFETIQFAVPIWKGTRPYQILPFQWSCHMETADGHLRHEEFLGLGPEAPMRDFAESLIRTLAIEGAILVYNQAFEATRIRELAGMFPDRAEDLTRLIARLVDLRPIAQKYYYHPDMKGSWSLKAVLPTVAPELDYAKLEHVQDGGSAGFAYFEILDASTDTARRKELIEALKKYCRQDTLGLVRLAHFFAQGSNT